MPYDFMETEKKWQKIWEESKVFCVTNDFSKPKYYLLIEFPYPSGNGLHVGHPRSYVALDSIARKRRLQGFNVLYPIGWDSFGLPTENFAIKNKIHPKIVTKHNIAHFKEQLKALGLSFDWSREVNTTDPKYYKWTQWIFSRLFERGLAEKRNTSVNWCVSCRCVLANEEVIAGKCERCNNEVIQKTKSQWILKITEYAQRLIDDLDLVDFPERVKQQQKNWIGRSEGALIKFKTTCGKDVEVYTTRPDTIFGATYLVLAPEHELVDLYSENIENIKEVLNYRLESSRKSDFERSEVVREKTGVLIKGIKAVNPLDGREIPIFLADYVLSNYGTGAIMAVPAHDERDLEFASKFGLDVNKVVKEDGLHINSEFLDGLDITQAKIRVTEELKRRGLGESKVNFRLRDWIFSRQRYWGEPIPIINCPKCGFVLEKNLPLELPEIQNFECSQCGESVLESSDWADVECPQCGDRARRETDTMPQWAGSSWYFLRYLDPLNDDALASPESLNYWLPINWYNGGMEHTTLHLLYSRFWHKFLYDIGVVPVPEPYAKRTSHGVILGENGEKMSKSRGNVVNPDEVISEYGADVMRLYEMFMGDFETAAPWSTQSIKGCKRFLEKFWDLQRIISGEVEIRAGMLNVLHKTIKKVDEDMEHLKFNTAIASLMTLVNIFRKSDSITREELKILTILLNPFAPHITEELWNVAHLGSGRITDQSWPKFDPEAIKDEEIEIVIQVNGKVRGRLKVNEMITQSELILLAKKEPVIERELNGKQVLKEIYFPKKLLNFVTYCH
ncbi:MAG: leucine--tRNA ligase [Oscillospiraceae bacterium]|nr:leucine--tRNA ligase [Oscillospiraceae bacterium]